MATFTEAFPGGNGAAWPAAWTTSTTSAGGTIDVQSASGRMLTAATAFHACRAILASASWNQADCEVYTFLQLQTGAGQANIALRASGTWATADNNSPDTGYKVLVNAAGGDFAFYKRLSGTTTQIGSSQPFTYTVGAIYAIRFRVQGTALKVKIWNSVSGEPVPWTYEQTDSSITAAGQLQLCYTTMGADARDGRWVGLAVTTDLGATGTLARTLGNVTCLASGSYGVFAAAPALNANTGTIAYATDPAVTVGQQFAFDFVDGAAGLFVATADDANPTGSVNVTLGNVTSVASGSGVVGTVSRTLADAVVAASGGSSASGTVARTLQPVVVQATGGQGTVGSVARTLANVTVVAAGAFGGGAGATGTVARTLDPVETASPLTDEFGNPILDSSGQPILDESGNPVLDESGNPLLDTSGEPIFVRGAEGTHGLAGAGLAVTLANVVAVASGSAGGASGTLAVTLANVTSTTAGASGAVGTVAKTLGAVTLSAAGGSGVTGTVARTLGNATVSAAGSETAGTVIRTLANTTSSAAGASGAAGTVARTLGAVTSAAAGTFTLSVSGTVAVALGNVTSSAAGTSTPPGAAGSLAETLDNVTLASSGTGVGGSVSRTLADTSSSASGASGATGDVARTLDAVTSSASGGLGAIGTLAELLDAVVAAAGGSSVAGAITETLDDLTSAAVGTAGLATVAGTANIILADLTSLAEGSLTTIGTVNRTLAELIADSFGSSVSGTLNEILADVTARTGGTGSYTDFQSVTIRERGHMITIREMSGN